MINKCSHPSGCATNRFGKSKYCQPCLEPVNGFKICTSCDEIKSIDNFSARYNRKMKFRGSCKKCDSTYKKVKVCAEDGCDKLIAKESTFCQKCWQNNERNPNYKGGRHIRSDGYVMILGHKQHPNVKKNGYIAEHIYIMSEYLERPLLKNENVHHKNGVRDDNRIENLELWHKGQPAGQRLDQKLQYYEEQLRVYKPELFV